MKCFVFVILLLCFKSETKACCINDSTSCDTILIEKFCTIAKDTYDKILNYTKFSIEDKTKAIRIYNTIFFLPDSVLENKEYLKNYQYKMNRNMGLNILKDSSICISKYSIIYFKQLDVALLNKFACVSGRYSCRDIFYVLNYH